MINESSSHTLVHSRSQANGLVRGELGGAGLTLAEAFDKAREADNLIWFYEDAPRQRRGIRLAHEGGGRGGHWDVCRFGDEFYLVSCDLSFENKRREYLPGDSLLEFHVRLSGELMLMTSRTNLLKVSGPSLLVWSLPEGQETEEAVPPQHERSVTIYFEPAHILKHYTYHDSIPVDLARFLLNRDDSVNYCTLPINPDIIGAATAIMSAGDRFQDLLWLNYVHAKAEELICIIITAFDQLSEIADVSFTEREIEQLREARRISASEIERPPTIKAIAHRIGTNETKLKQGFRAMYGETVFQYRNRKRMDLAMQLIVADEPLPRVAERVGFRHQTSFTTAFKSYFGVSPKECRNR